MSTKLEVKNRAIELRRLGKSYKEIQATIPVSKGLLSLWLSKLDLTLEERAKLRIHQNERKGKGRMNALIANKARRIEREKRTHDEAAKVFKKKRKDPFFLMGIFLYWSLGSKKGTHFEFMSSDPDMVFLMYKWIRRHLEAPKEKIKVRIFMQNHVGQEGIKDFWSKNLGIEPYSVKTTSVKGKERKDGATPKADPYKKGSVRLEITEIRYHRLMKAWQKLFIQYYG